MDATGPVQQISPVLVAPRVRAFTAADLGWAEELVAEMGGRHQARLGQVVDVLALPALVAEVGGEPVGLLAFDERGADAVEIAYLHARTRHAGVGTALVDALRERAGARTIWLVTTNDNVDALRFYQRRGFRLRELRAGAVEETRRTLKPSLPQLGDHGIPIRDELVLVRDS